MVSVFLLKQMPITRKEKMQMTPMITIIYSCKQMLIIATVAMEAHARAAITKRSIPHWC